MYIIIPKSHILYTIQLVPTFKVFGKEAKNQTALKVNRKIPLLPGVVVHDCNSSHLESRRIPIQCQSGKTMRHYLKNKLKKNTKVWLNGSTLGQQEQGPEFNPQYHQKKKERKKKRSSSLLLTRKTQTCGSPWNLSLLLIPLSILLISELMLTMTIRD
jgi:hypothetical protein